MENLNIRIYKVIPENDVPYFEWKEDESKNGETYTVMQSLAISIKLQMNSFLKRTKHKMPASIDFRPYHDIIWLSHYPVRCVPLDAGEQAKFWKEFKRYSVD